MVSPPMSRSIRSSRHQTLRRLLNELRITKGLTQADVARRLKRPQSFVAKVEGGERRLDLVEFIEIVEAMGGDPVALLRKIVRAS